MSPLFAMALLHCAEHGGVEVGPKEDKLGIRASSTCPVSFSGCEVPKGNVLGKVRLLPSPRDHSDGRLDTLSVGVGSIGSFDRETQSGVRLSPPTPPCPTSVDEETSTRKRFSARESFAWP